MPTLTERLKLLQSGAGFKSPVVERMITTIERVQGTSDQPVIGPIQEDPTEIGKPVLFNPITQFIPSLPPPVVKTHVTPPAPFLDTPKASTEWEAQQAAYAVEKARRAEEEANKVTGGGGGLTMRPWWDILPKTPTEAATRTLETPTVSPVGLFGIGGPKTIIKVGGKILPAALGLGGGFLLARLFGGGSQEQQQEITQQPDVDVTVTPDVDVTPTVEVIPTVIPTQQPIVQPKISFPYGTVGGDVGGTTIHEYQTTSPTTHTSTITETYTTTTTPTTTLTYAGQEATQKQDQSSLLMIAAVAGIALLMMWKK